MTISADSQQKIDAYLSVLRKRLRGLSDQRDVVEEIRSHILDRAAVGGDITPDAVESALTALGSPAELARQYLADDLLTRAQVTRSPWLMLRSLFRWAGLSIAGFWVLIFSLAGYCVAIAFALCAVLKPMYPHTTGLWLLPDPADISLSLRLGLGSPPPGAHELLGWWIVPLGLSLGSGVIFSTFRLGQWSIRKYWRGPVRAR